MGYHIPERAMASSQTHLQGNYRGKSEEAVCVSQGNQSVCFHKCLISQNQSGDKKGL